MELKGSAYGAWTAGPGAWNPFNGIESDPDLHHEGVPDRHGNPFNGIESS